MTTWDSLAKVSDQLPKDCHRAQRKYISCVLKSFYRRFGVDLYTYGDCDISVEKLRRIWKFLFSLSLCENSMDCQHKLNNPHMHFHSLLHTLTGLSENQRPSVQFQELLYLIWFWRLSQYRIIYVKSSKHKQKDPLTRTQSAEEAHRSLQ